VDIVQHTQQTNAFSDMRGSDTLFPNYFGEDLLYLVCIRVHLVSPCRLEFVGWSARPDRAGFRPDHNFSVVWLFNWFKLVLNCLKLVQSSLVLQLLAQLYTSFATVM